MDDPVNDHRSLSALSAPGNLPHLELFYCVCFNDNIERTLTSVQIPMSIKAPVQMFITSKVRFLNEASLVSVLVL